MGLPLWVPVVARSLRAPFVFLPRRSRSYLPWHISPASGGNPALLLWIPAFAGMTEVVQSARKRPGFRRKEGV